VASPVSSAEVRSPGRSLELATAAARAAEDNNGRDIVILDMRGQAPIFDYFVVATGTSQRQLRAMADSIDDTLQKEYNCGRFGQEGYQDTAWVLLDFGTVVVHLFDEKTRDYYRLEDLWSGAQPVAWK
jgi:ribosome-associated protein